MELIFFLLIKTIRLNEITSYVWSAKEYVYDVYNLCRNAGKKQTHKTIIEQDK